MGEQRLRAGLPEDLEAVPAGPRLCAVLAEVDRAALSECDRLRLLQARNRLSAHVQGEMFADLYAVGLDEPRDDAATTGAADRDRWACSEVAFAMTWTETAAGARLAQARQLLEELPEVFAALRSGRVDMPKVLVMCELASWLEDPCEARRVVRAVVDRAPELTTGQLRAKLRQLVLAVDPEAARRRCARALRTRRVETVPNPDGTGELWGRSLPPQDAAAAWERLTAIARAAKAAGDDRTLDQLRADALLDLLVGEGIAVGEPVTRHLAGLPESDGHPYGQVPGGPPRHRPLPLDPAEQTPGSAPEPRSGQPSPTGLAPGRRAHPTGDWDPAWPLVPPQERLRPDQLSPHPAGQPVDAVDAADGDFDGVGLWPPDWPGRWVDDPAVTAAGAGRDALGRPAGDGHRPPAGADPAAGRREGRSARARAAALPAPRRGVVELLLPVSTATGQDDLPGEIAGWGPVLADIARHIAKRQQDGQWRFSTYGRLGELVHHGIVAARPARHPPRRTGRRPAARVAAHVKARNRTCTAPGCRVPSSACDLDHTLDWSRGGESVPNNLGPGCRRHHRFKHEAGGTLWQLDPGGVFVWTTRSGLQYLTRPEPPLLDRRQLPGPAGATPPTGPAGQPGAGPTPPDTS